jgi:spore germination protein
MACIYIGKKEDSKMKKINPIIVMCLVMLLTGCQVITPLNISEIGMIQGMGFDKTTKGKMLGTVLYPEYNADETSKIKVLKAKGETVRKVIDIAKNEVDYPLVNGQLRTALFGRKLAEEGIYPLIDTFGRSPTIGNLLQLAVVDGNASELLTINAENEKNISLYIQEMIEHNILEGELPSTDITVFNYKFYEEGSDPYLPLLKKQKDHIKISGLALFDDDRLKLTLPVKDVFIFKLLEERFKMGAHQFKVHNDEYVVISNIKATPHYNVKMKKGVPEFSIRIKMNARIQEYTGKKHIVLNKKITEFEKEINGMIKRDAERIIGDFQKNDIDPLGLGAKYEAHYRDFNFKKWDEQYPDVKVNVKVDLNIANSGVVE